jgi:hypothetical protein
MNEISKRGWRLVGTEGTPYRARYFATSAAALDAAAAAVADDHFRRLGLIEVGGYTDCTLSAQIRLSGEWSAHIGGSYDHGTASGWANRIDRVAAKAASHA